MIEIREYLGRDGRNLFGDWIELANKYWLDYKQQKRSEPWR
jgi:hypothetical protein